MKSFALAAAACAATLGLSGTAPADPDPQTPAPELKLAQEVLAEMNRLRVDPEGYVAVLADYRGQFDGDLVIRPGRVTIQTQEGVAAVDEAIRSLRRQPALSPLEPDAVLRLAAADLVRDQGETGETGHVSSDGLDFGARMARRGGDPYGGENISYGYDTAREVVLQLLIDDGVPSRGHRANLLGPRFARAGVACGPHPVMDHLCVVDYGFGRGD